ncbi:MAG: hypothetical protein AB1414_16575 [bacterium]
MENKFEKLAYRLGLHFQLFCAYLVKYGIEIDSKKNLKDSEIRTGCEKYREILCDIIKNLGISVNLPMPRNREEIFHFFTNDLSNITMEIGERLSIIHSTRISYIFHLSSSIAGYLNAIENRISIPAINVLKSSIEKQSQDLGIKKKTVLEFLESPSRGWDHFVKEMLRDEQDDKLNDLIILQPNLWGVGFDLKKALNLLKQTRV